MTTCDAARDLLFDEHAGLLDDQRLAELRTHLAGCAACRVEEADLSRAYGVLSHGVRAPSAAAAPSAAFYHGLEARLDAVDAERARARRPGRPARRRRWWGAIAALAAALAAGLIVSGGAAQAWAALRQLFYVVPAVEVGQQEATALVAVAPAASNNGTLTLTVTGLVSGRRVTLVSYRLSGRALTAPSSTAPVADAVQAVLVDGRGHRYELRYWLPITRGAGPGSVPRVEGLLAFPALDAGTRTARFEAARLPLAPPGRPWTVRLSLRPAAAGGAQTSLPVNSSAVHHGVRLAVTDLTRAGGATVVDMDSAVAGGPYRGGSVVSLAPEQAIGPFAPELTTVGGAIGARISPLPAPVRQALLARPELVFPAVIAPGAASFVVVPAVQVSVPGSAIATVSGGMAPRTLRLGATGVTVVRADIVALPAALGLGDERRLSLTLAFPPARVDGTLDSVDVVVDGVGRTVERADPRVDIPLTPGQRGVTIAVQRPIVTVEGPWSLAVRHL